MDHILSERSAFFYEDFETKSVWIYGIDGKKHYEGHQNFPRPRLKKEADSSNIISRVFIKGTEHKTIRACLLSVSQRPVPRTSRWRGIGTGLRGFTVLVQEQSPPSLLSFSLPLPRASLLKRKYKPVC